MSTSLQSCGDTNSGILRTMTGLRFATAAGFEVAAAGAAAADADSALGLPVHTASALVRVVFASMKGVGRLPTPSAICFMVRPDATERSSASNAPSSPGLALESRCLISNQLVRLPP